MKLTGNTVVRHPDTGRPVVLVDGQTVPEWASALITNPALLVPDEAAATQDNPEPSPDAPPPRAGRGSGRDAWAAYAAQITDTPVDSWAVLGRDEVIDLLVEQGVLGDEE